MKRLKSGDLIKLPIDAVTFGVGQIVETGDILKVIVFDGVWGGDFDYSKIEREDVLLAAYTLDALLYHGRWSVIGNEKINFDLIPNQNFIGTNGGVDVVENNAGDILRPATKQDLCTLTRKKVVAPIRVHKAFLSSQDVEGYPWNEKYDHLLADYQFNLETYPNR